MALELEIVSFWHFSAEIRGFPEVPEVAEVPEVFANSPEGRSDAGHQT